MFNNKDIINIIVKYYDNNPFLFDPSFIEKYLDKIDWICLSKNTNIPFTFFEKYSDKINWILLSENINIPHTFIEKYKDKIDWYWLSQNIKCWNKNKLYHYLI